MCWSDQEWLFDCGFRLVGPIFFKSESDREYRLKEVKTGKFMLSRREARALDIWTERGILGLRQLFEDLQLSQ